MTRACTDLIYVFDTEGHSNPKCKGVGDMNRPHVPELRVV